MAQAGHVVGVMSVLVLVRVCGFSVGSDISNSGILLVLSILSLCLYTRSAEV